MNNISAGMSEIILLHIIQNWTALFKFHHGKVQTIYGG